MARTDRCSNSIRVGTKGRRRCVARSEKMLATKRETKLATMRETKLVMKACYIKRKNTIESIDYNRCNKTHVVTVTPIAPHPRVRLVDESGESGGGSGAKGGSGLGIGGGEVWLVSFRAENARIARFLAADSAPHLRNVSSESWREWENTWAFCTHVGGAPTDIPIT